MSTVERVEAIRVLVNTLQVVTELKGTADGKNQEIARAIRNKILSYIEHI